MIRIAFALLLLILASCVDNKDERYSSYFNVQSAIRADKAILIRDKAMLIKTVKSDQNKDNVKNNKPDWNLEFELFNKLSISSHEFENRFTVDTTFFFPIKNDSSIRWKRVTYKPVDADKETVKELTVEWDQKGQLKYFSGITQSSDLVTTITKTYYYEPQKKYKVDALENSGWLGTSHYSVEGYIYFGEPYFE